MTPDCPPLERKFPPGAATPTLPPTLEYDASCRSGPTAVTDSTSGYDAGKLGLDDSLLPAEATTSVPAFVAAMMALCSVVELEPPPKLMLMTDARDGAVTVP